MRENLKFVHGTCSQPMTNISAYLATCRFSRFYVVSVAEYGSLRPNLSRTPTTGVLSRRGSKIILFLF